jgi:hypothetical protein
MVIALAHHQQTYSLNRTAVRSILDVHELLVFCPVWQTQDYFESYIIAAWHHPDIM